MKKIDPIKWFFIGCISTEDRCLKAYDLLQITNSIDYPLFVEISDPPNSDKKLIDQKIMANKEKLLKSGIPLDIRQMELLCADYEIVQLAESISFRHPKNVIFDITSFPKRYFFPLIKLLSQDDTIENIIITYTQPEKYASRDLSDDPEPWYPLPLFRLTEHPEPNYDLAFVGTGFMPSSLPKLLKDNHSEISLRLFFPFPPGPPNYQRSWEFIRKIEKHYNFKDRDHIVRVDALDVNATYNYLHSSTDDGDKRCLFAPYGPKPISLAMCLFAIRHKAPVFYTQPKYYNPDYSTGAKETIAYPIRLLGHDYFK